MNFIISIFLVLFLSISSCQREATGDIVPTPAARYGEVDLTFGESGQPWNLPDGTMRVINGRPDNVNIYIFNDALDYRKHAITRIPTCNPASNCLTVHTASMRSGTSAAIWGF